MLITTLGYIENEDSYLMLHRIKKKNDFNHDKWVGIGGKLEAGESVLACMKRECLEETGLNWTDPKLRAVISFVYHPEEGSSKEPFNELMFLFTGSQYSGSLEKCPEGILEWVSKTRLHTLPLWRGDLIFFYYLDHMDDLFFMRLEYQGDELIEASLNDQPLDVNDPRWSKKN